jgi:hypothetical protein
MPDMKSFFIKNSSGLFVGFVAVLVDQEGGRDVISDIKMFSFGLDDKDDENQMYKDMPKFLDDLVKKYKKVSWGALDGNKANRVYAIVTKKYKGIIEKSGNHIQYKIEV